MVKPLSKDDFRATRKILESKDFALSLERTNPSPTDVIDEEIWNHLTNLPDNVAIWTTNHCGSAVKELCDYKYLWLMLINGNNPKQPCLGFTMISIYEEIDATIFNLLHGYYRQSFVGLRSVLELIVIGAYLEISNQQLLCDKWITGLQEIKFGTACDNLQQYQPIKKLEDCLAETVSDYLFQQRDPTRKYAGGYARQLFSKLSKYTHSHPGYTNGDLWQSNGPVFDFDSFKKVTNCYIEVIAFCILITKIVKNEYLSGSDAQQIQVKLFDSEIIGNIPILKKASHYLFENDTSSTN